MGSAVHDTAGAATPFERADHDSDFYTRFFIDHMFVMVPAQTYVAEFLQTFQAFPPRQTPASFTIDQVLQKMAPRRRTKSVKGWLLDRRGHPLVTAA